jgi:hypothetical protein
MLRPQRLLERLQHFLFQNAGITFDCDTRRATLDLTAYVSQDIGPALPRASSGHTDGGGLVVF